MKQLGQPYNKLIKVKREGYLTVGVNEHYKAYIHHNGTVDYKLYKDILNFMFIRIWNYMFKERWIFTAPVNFGQFYVAETPETNRSYKNWKSSKLQKKIIKSYNFHTSGRQFYFKWNKLLTKMFNKTYYKFIPFRGNAGELSGKRGLASWIKNCSVDPYLEDFRGHII